VSRTGCRPPSIEGIWWRIRRPSSAGRSKLTGDRNGARELVAPDYCALEALLDHPASIEPAWEEQGAAWPEREGAAVVETNLGRSRKNPGGEVGLSPPVELAGGVLEDVQTGVRGFMEGLTFEKLFGFGPRVSPAIYILRLKHRWSRNSLSFSCGWE
jgi:hypothetical protein